MPLNATWRRCASRFDEVEKFIDETAAMSGASHPMIRSNLYGSWVLLTYSCCQYSLAEIGTESMALLGRKYKYPSKLPEPLFKLHERGSVETAWRILEGKSKMQGTVRQAFSDSYSGNWANSSRLLSIDWNVWPNNVKEWLRRLGVTDTDLSWMSEPVSPNTSDTFNSRLEELVQERNPIAHGQPANNLRSREVMKEWLGHCKGFMERCAMTVELRFATSYGLAGAKIGKIDTGQTARLGKSTVAIMQLVSPVHLGDHVLLKLNRDSQKIARIESIRSEGKDYTDLPAGHQRVAISFNKQHQSCSIFQVP